MKLPFGRPALGPYAQYWQKPVSAGVVGSGVSACFLGTSSLLLHDGDTAVLSDGFVTRPGLARVLAGTIAPDQDVVAGAINRLGVVSLAAVFCCHSHYDHALDAPVWAEQLGADLVGSASTVNVGRGWGLPETALKVVGEGEALTYGEFRLEFVTSLHSPGDRYPGTIDQPLVAPAKAGAWKTGLVYSVFITHRGRTILIHASANARPGALAGRRAEVVYLGIGGLGRQDEVFAEQYWNEVVRATGAKRVILVHWDDFFRRLDEPLRPMRYPLDDFDRGMHHILTRAHTDNVEVLLPVPWQHTDPFENSPANDLPQCQP